MNPLLAEALSALAAPYVKSCIDYFSGQPNNDEDMQDVEAMAEELREVMRERDDLRRQLRDIRTAHEALHRAVYPGLASMKWNLGK
jgi:hypothetical protein